MSENVDCLQKYRKMTFADDDACLPPALFSQPFNAVLWRKFPQQLKQKHHCNKKGCDKNAATLNVEYNSFAKIQLFRFV